MFQILFLITECKINKQLLFIDINHRKNILNSEINILALSNAFNKIFNNIYFL